jgi:hypoxanthine phosphoribosyltransferase
MPVSSSTPVVSLTELSELIQRLSEKVRAAGFQPDVLVYIETGARLPAWELCRELGVGAIPVVARRRGHALKRWMAPLARLLPRSIMDAMRRAEERSGVHARTGRRVVFPVAYDFRNKAILLVDDAADTGGTLVAVRQELVQRGADVARLRTAVLAATTPAGRARVDFYMLDRNSVLPWSSDSCDRKEAQALMAKVNLPSP